MNGWRAGSALLPAALAAAAQALAAEEVSPLLGQALDQVHGATAAEGQEGGLFRRLQRRLDGSEPAPKASARPSSAPATRQSTDAKRGAADLVPSLAYAMEQLDPASFALLRPVPVAGSGARLRTGDVFVLQFSTSLPGQVRLENIDPAGRVADLGTYTVLVDQLNRIPRDRGIQLQGRPGQERLRFFFYPCLPREAAGKPWAADYQGRLPPCAAMPAVQVAGAAEAAAYGAVTPRALVKLEQPDATMVFAGASGYRPGEVTLLEARIRHDPPAGR